VAWHGQPPGHAVRSGSGRRVAPRGGGEATLASARRSDCGCSAVAGWSGMLRSASVRCSRGTGPAELSDAIWGLRQLAADDV
jgi:hypothetical protein